MYVSELNFDCVICEKPRDLHGPMRWRADRKGPACARCIRQYDIDKKVEMRDKKLQGK